MTSRLAPVLPSTIVTVTLLGDFAGADGGRVAVAAGWVESAGAAACGTAMTSGAFLAMRRSAGATAIGSPPERSSAVTAHNTNAPKNRPSATAVIFAAETSIAWRCLLGTCPSGAVRFFIVMRDPVPDQRVRFRPNPQPRAIRESRQRAYHGISAASR